MKKSLMGVLVVVSLILTFTASGVLAQPYTDGLVDDDYGIEQGGVANGIPTPKDNNDGLPDINDAINFLLSPIVPFDRNKDVDFLQWTLPDHTWRDLSDDANDGTFVLIGLTASFTNTLGVYDTDSPGVHLPVLGPFSGFGFAGDGIVDPLPAGLIPGGVSGDFGWYLDTNSNTWDSDPTLNTLGIDHMITYHLAALSGEEILIGFGCTGTVGDLLDPITCISTEDYTFNDPYLIAWEDKPFANGKLGDEDYDDMIFLVDRVQPVAPEPISLVLFGTGLAGMAGLRRRKQS